MKTLRQFLCLVLALTLSGGLTAGPLAGETPPPAAPASSAAAADPWPRQVKSGTTVFLVYQPQLDSWKDNQLEAPCGRVGPDGRRQGPDLRRHLVHGAHRRRQGQPPRLSRGREHHAIELPVGAGQGGGMEAALHELEPGKKLQGHLPRPARGGPRDRAGEGRGESRPLDNAPPQIIFSNVPAVLVLVDGHPGLPPQSGTDLQRADQHELDRPEGGLGRALSPPLRRLDGGVRRSRARGRFPTRTSARKDNLDKALKAILAAKNGDPMTGGSASDPKAPETVAQDQARPGRLHGDAADRARRRRRRSRTTTRSRAPSSSTSRTRPAASSRTSTTRTPTS